MSSCPGSDNPRCCTKDSANSSEIKSLTEGCVHCSGDYKRARQKSIDLLWKPKEPACQRIKMIQYAFSSRKTKSGYEK